MFNQYISNLHETVRVLQLFTTGVCEVRIPEEHHTHDSEQVHEDDEQHQDQTNSLKYMHVFGK